LPRACWPISAPRSSRCQAHCTGAEQNDTAISPVGTCNKLGITLDLSRAEARQLALEACQKCDLVMENFTARDGRLGLGYSDLKLVNPAIVMVSLSGFGHTGSWRNCTALGTTIQALSGLTQLTSYDTVSPDGIGFACRPRFGLYAVLAALPR
jgi:crotonobetainyl-CoA:carnitine CoA-transferase CaiB-like acyl-CoA transferase